MFGKLFGGGDPVEINESTVLIDVRSPAEYSQGHAVKALNWPLDQLSTFLEKNGPMKDKDIVIYCASGARAGVAQNMMNRAGFEKVTNVGGIQAVAHLGLE